MPSKGLGALLSAVVIGLVMPAAALAAKPAATTGIAANVTYQSASLNGSVDPNKEATTYYFQYGTTIALDARTASVPAGGGDKAVHKSVDIAGLAPLKRYYYRIVAQNNSGTVLGERRSFKTKAQPLGFTLVATPNPVPAKESATTLAGTLTGTNNAGRQVVLQSNPWPYTQGFQNTGNPQVTSQTGGFAFALLSVALNTQYRVAMPERAGFFSGVVAFGVKPYVKSKVSKRRVQRGHRIRFTGSVTPVAADQQIAFQKKSTSGWVTVGGTRLHGSHYSGRLKVRRGGTYRVWTGATSGQYASNNGKSFKIKTFR